MDVIGGGGFPDLRVSMDRPPQSRIRQRKCCPVRCRVVGCGEMLSRMHMFSGLGHRKIGSRVVEVVIAE